MATNDTKFRILTESQNERDTAAVSAIRRHLVLPLLEQIEESIPGYSKMNEWEKFAALMGINEENAFRGSGLVLDFGQFWENGIRMRSVVFSGSNRFVFGSMECPGEDFKTYDCFLADSDWGIGRGNSLRGNILYLAELDPGYLEHFPLPFRVALVALGIRQNALVYFEDSCRFAAGLDDSIRTRRFGFTPAESANWQRIGWTIWIRDTKPENAMLATVARSIRAIREDESKKFPGYPSNDADESFMPLYAPDKSRPRTRRQSTELLVDFIDRVLPEKGMHTGKSGTGDKISWDKAWRMFDELHPNIYSSAKSFSDSYYNAKRARGR